MDTENTPAPPAASAPPAAKIETITLTEPLLRGSTQISELGLRKPRAGELRGLDVQDLVTGDVNALLVLLPRICVPPILAAEAEQLDLADIAQIAGAVRGFFMTRQEWQALQKYLGTDGAEETSTN